MVYCNRIVSVFKHIYVLLTCKISSSSDDALLVNAKRQNVKKKHGFSRLDFYLKNFDLNVLKYLH